MNITRLNYGTLKDAVVIKGAGSGGGVQINNQSKSVEITENGRTSVTHDADYTGLSKVDISVNVPPKNQEKAIEITENGTTEVTADSGFTGLGKVVVNTNVASGGGDDIEIPEDPTITCLYISIPKGYPKTVSIYYQQNSEYSQEIDWGDGSAVEKSDYITASGTSSATHVYSKEGNYRISFKPLKSTAILTFGHRSDTVSIMGGIGNIGLSYNTIPIQYIYLKQVHIGTQARIGDYGLMYCSNLTKVSFAEGNNASGPGKKSFYNSAIEEYEFPNGVTSFSQYAFDMALRLKKLQLSNVKSIPNNAFNFCISLYIIKLPSSVTSIGNSIVGGCNADVIVDISEHTQIPTISTSSFNLPMNAKAKVVVPDSLYEDIIIATNWSSITDSIIKKSDWDAQNT